MIERAFSTTLELNHPVAVWHGPEFYGGGDGDSAVKYSISFTKGGSAATTTGLSGKAYFVRADGVTVECAAPVSSSAVTYELVQDCFNVPGPCVVSFKVGDSNGERTVLVLNGAVLSTGTDLLSLTSGAVADLALLEQKIDAKIPEPETEGLPGYVLTTDGHGGRTWEDPAVATVAGSVEVDGTSYILRTGTAGAAGYLTLVTEA